MRKRGNKAYSCDIQPCSGGHPEWHILGDVTPFLDGNCEFTTMDGVVHKITGSWDLIIGHPPCTYLCNASSIRLRRGGQLDEARMEKAREAKEFFLRILNANCPRIAVENPVPGRIHELPPYTQIIEPYWFGEPWKKRTCLWLKNLPLLVPTDLVEPTGLWVGSTSKRTDPGFEYRYQLTGIRNSKERSKTFQGIANAFAEQWTFAA